MWYNVLTLKKFKTSLNSRIHWNKDPLCIKMQSIKCHAIAYYVESETMTQMNLFKKQKKSQRYRKQIRLLLLLSHFNRVWLCATHRGQPTRLPRPCYSPGKNTGVVAISFSNAWNWKVKGKSLNTVRLLATPRTAAYQAPPFMGFSILLFFFGGDCTWDRRF